MPSLSKPPSGAARFLLGTGFSPPTRRVFQLILVACCFVTARAGYDGIVCCLKAAREPGLREGLNDRPWRVCSLNETSSYAEGTTFPSVNQTMNWCRERCPGFQYSQTSQWLQPLANWLAPYLGLLLLCPTGADGGDAVVTSWLRKHTPSFGVWLIEYANILGDPASALFGAFSEVYSDARTIWMLQSQRKPGPIQDGRFRRVRRMMQKYLMPSYDMAAWSTQLYWVSILANDMTLDDMQPATPGVMQRVLDTASRTAITTIIKARPNFYKSIFLPVILMLAVTASVFFDAYGKLGDNDTAHGLAFGVWFSWLLTLSVAANCFASGLSYQVTRTALRPYIKLANRRIPLRDRYINSFRWGQWVGQSTNRKESSSLNPDRSAGQSERLASDAPPSGKDSTKAEARQSTEGIRIEAGETVNRMPELKRSTWLIFFVGQIVLGWSAVALSSAGAIAISWMTPTVGLGCRSFTFLVYGIIAAVVAVLNVLRQWAKPGGNRESALAKLLEGTYWCLVLVNASWMVLGTTFHLVGLYRSCRCKRLFASGSDMVELNRNTPQAVDNAEAFWLPVGYVVFGLQWIACGLVVVARKYIAVHITLMLKNEEAIEEDAKQGEKV